MNTRKIYYSSQTKTNNYNKTRKASKASKIKQDKYIYIHSFNPVLHIHILEEQLKENQSDNTCTVNILEEQLKESNTPPINKKCCNYKSYVEVIRAGYKHFQKIYVHFYALTIFEIFFYFYFIIPYEKRVISGLFTSLLPSNTINIHNNTVVSIKSILQKIHIIDKCECARYIKEVNGRNVSLFWSAMSYIICSSTFLFAMIVYDAYQYRYYKPNKENKYCICNSNSNSNSNIETNDNVISKHICQNTETGFYEYSLVIRECRSTLSFLFIIIVFEYLFFVNIVEKYVVANSKTVMCENM